MILHKLGTNYNKSVIFVKYFLECGFNSTSRIPLRGAIALSNWSYNYADHIAI